MRWEEGRPVDWIGCRSRYGTWRNLSSEMMLITTWMVKGLKHDPGTSCSWSPWKPPTLTYLLMNLAKAKTWTVDLGHIPPGGPYTKPSSQMVHGFHGWGEKERVPSKGMQPLVTQSWSPAWSACLIPTLGLWQCTPGSRRGKMDLLLCLNGV